jgi:hypothetical protein
MMSLTKDYTEETPQNLTPNLFLKKMAKFVLEGNNTIEMF